MAPVDDEIVALGLARDRFRDRGIEQIFRAAAQGDTKAGRQLLEVIARAESARSEKALGLLQFSHQYKEKYAPIFEKHEREGLDPPDIYPHPDDIDINEATGEVTIDGPTDKEGAGARNCIRLAPLALPSERSRTACGCSLACTLIESRVPIGFRVRDPGALRFLRGFRLSLR